MNKFILIGKVSKEIEIKKTNEEEYMELNIEIINENKVVPCILPIRFKDVINYYPIGTIAGINGHIDMSNNKVNLIVDRLQTLYEDELH